MREAYVPGQEYSILYCEDCSEEKGTIIPMELIHGLLNTLMRQSWEIKADVHERAHDHNTVLVNADYKQ